MEEYWAYVRMLDFSIEKIRLEISKGDAIRAGCEAGLLADAALFTFPWLRETYSKAIAA
jgi:hypothetical protein